MISPSHCHCLNLHWQWMSQCPQGHEPPRNMIPRVTDTSAIEWSNLRWLGRRLAWAFSWEFSVFPSAVQPNLQIWFPSMALLTLETKQNRKERDWVNWVDVPTTSPPTLQVWAQCCKQCVALRCPFEGQSCVCHPREKAPKVWASFSELLLSFLPTSSQMSQTWLSCQAQETLPKWPLAHQKKRVNIVFLELFTLCGWVGRVSLHCSQTDDCLLVSGSNVEIQVSSQVTIVLRKLSGSALHLLKFSSQSWARTSFWVSDKNVGTRRAALFLAWRSLRRMLKVTVSLSSASIASSLTLLLLSSDNKSLTASMFLGVLELCGCPGRGKSFVEVVKSPWEKRRCQKRTCVSDIVFCPKTTLRERRQSQGRFPDCTRNLSATRCSFFCTLSAILTTPTVHRNKHRYNGNLMLTN